MTTDVWAGVDDDAVRLHFDGATLTIPHDHFARALQIWLIDLRALGYEVKDVGKDYPNA